jgi:hypothetical protein
LVLPVSWVAAVVLAILAATAPFTLTWAGSPQADGQLLSGQATSGRQAIAVAGLVLAAAVVLRAAGCVVGSYTVVGRSDASTQMWLPPLGVPATSRV